MNEQARRKGVEATVHRLVLRLGPVVRTVAQYPEGHPSLQRPVASVVELFGAALAAGGETAVHVQGATLFIDHEPSRIPPGMVASVEDLDAILGGRGCGGIVIRGVPTPEQAERALRVLVADPGDSPDMGARALNAILDGHGISALRFAPRHGAETDEIAGADTDPALLCLRLYLRGVRSTAYLLDKGLGAHLLAEFGQVARGIVELEERWPRRALALATPRRVVPHSHRHPFHTAVLAVAIGRRLGLDAAALTDLAWSALAADCGMSDVPLPVRDAAGPLAPDQREEVEAHPGCSVRQLLRRPRLDLSLRRLVAVGFEHHRALDGTGYPAALSWGPLHPFTRIVAVAGAYDALRADTPWRGGMRPDEAIRTLRAEAGTRYDPAVVGQLAAIVEHETAQRRAAGLALPGGDP